MKKEVFVMEGLGTVHSHTDRVLSSLLLVNKSYLLQAQRLLVLNRFWVILEHNGMLGQGNGVLCYRHKPYAVIEEVCGAHTSRRERGSPAPSIGIQNTEIQPSEEGEAAVMSPYHHAWPAGLAHMARQPR